MSKGTTKRSIRIEDNLWEKAKLDAGAIDLTVSDLIRAYLRIPLSRPNPESIDQCLAYVRDQTCQQIK